MPEVTYSTPDNIPYYLKNLPNITILNLQGVFEDHSLHISIRQQAGVLIQGLPVNGVEQSYCNAGYFFFNATNFTIADLFVMQQGFDDSYSEWLVSPDLAVQHNLRNLTTLAFLLARGEGICELSPVVLVEALPNLCKLIKLESSFRKGLSKSIPDYRRYYVLNTSSIMNKEIQGD